MLFGNIVLHRYVCNIILPEIKNKMPKQVNVSEEEQLLFIWKKEDIPKKLLVISHKITETKCIKSKEEMVPIW